MRWFIYDFVLFILMIVLLPHYYLKMKRRGGYKANFKNRFGRYDSDTLARFGNGAILIHAVSVGEVAVADQFMKSMRRFNPDQRFVISTTSSTGWKEAEKRITDQDVLIYNPLDLPCFVKRALDAIRPSAFIMVETEIWPNLIRQCERRGIPMCIINGRLSDKTAPAYRRLRFWFGPALRAIRLIQVQSKLDEERYIAAGADPKSVSVTGSFKFDVANRRPDKEESTAKLLSEMQLDPPRKILLAASTWDGEEKILLDCYRKLLPVHADLRLVLVPRHMERRDAVVRQICDAGFNAVLKSEINSGARKIEPLSANEVLLVDTTGEIMGFFPFASISFVGRTFCSKGGQNMVEPCLCGVPTVVGPETQNFRSVMHDLLDSKSIIQLDSPDKLEPKLSELLSDEAMREELGARAEKTVLARKGVVDRCVLSLLETINRFPNP